MIDSLTDVGQAVSKGGKNGLYSRREGQESWAGRNNRYSWIHLVAHTKSSRKTHKIIHAITHSLHSPTVDHGGEPAPDFFQGLNCIPRNELQNLTIIEIKE